MKSQARTIPEAFQHKVNMASNKHQKHTKHVSLSSNSNHIWKIKRSLTVAVAREPMRTTFSFDDFKLALNSLRSFLVHREAGTIFGIAVIAAEKNRECGG